MIQNIVVGTIIAAVVLYIFLRFKSNAKSGACPSCSGGCTHKKRRQY